MRITRLFGFSLAAVLAATVAWAARAVDYTVAAMVAFVEMAFPPPDNRFDFVPVAAAPRITGLHQARSFHQRLLKHSGDGRRRAPLSSAFSAQSLNA